MSNYVSLLTRNNSDASNLYVYDSLNVPLRLLQHITVIVGYSIPISNLATALNNSTLISELIILYYVEIA